MLYRNWAKNNKKHSRGRGKPAAVPEIVSTSKDLFKNRSHDSSTVKCLHMKEVIASKKKSQAAKVGLDPDLVECKVSTRNAKVNMVMAATTSKLSFFKKKLLIKTWARFRAEYLVISACSYAMTVLMTHFSKDADLHE